MLGRWLRDRSPFAARPTHGVRTLSPDEVVLARVTRGRNRGTLQNLSLIRLRSLSEEVAKIVAVMESLLYSNGVIEGMTEASRRYFQDQR